MKPPPAFLPHDPWDVASLATADLFLLQSLRLWAVPREGIDWQRGFLAAGIAGDGLVAFERAMSALAAGARPRLSVHRASCRGVARDEAIVLGVVAALQQGRLHAAVSSLRRRWPETVVRVALVDLARVGAALGETGLRCGMAQHGPGLAANPAGPVAGAALH